MIINSINANYFFVLIFFLSYSLLFADSDYKSYKENSAEVYLKKSFQMIDLDSSEFYFRTTLAKYNAPLYQLAGNYFDKPVTIKQWVKIKKDEQSFSDQIYHRFTLLGDNYIYIQQTMLYSYPARCQVFDTRTQKLFKPKSCFSGDLANIEYKKLDAKHFAIWSSGEGVSAFSFVTFDPFQGQKVLLEIGLAYAQIDQVRYKNEILYFNSNCNVIKPCKIVTKLKKNTSLKFKWSKATGLVAVNGE